MALPRGDRVFVATDTKLEELPLKPEEFFVLSRIEGEATVGYVVSASGLGEGATEAILERLLEVGALKRVAEQDVAGEQEPVNGRLSKEELKRRTGARRRQMLVSQLGAAKSNGAAVSSGAPEPSSSTGPPADTRADASSPESAHQVSGPPPPVAAESVSDGLRPTLEIQAVGPMDERLDATLDVPVDEQRWLLGLKDRLDRVSLFALLGVEPIDDERAVRRAYFDISRRLHPDRYYGKNLGAFRSILDELFARAKTAYATLLDGTKRGPYVARLREFEERRRRAEAQHRARQEEQEQQVRAAEEAQSREARRQRDEERAMRRRQRVATTFRNKGRQHFEAGQAAEAEGNMPAAANNYRMASQLDPTVPEYHERWQVTLGIARRKRAEGAFVKALSFLQIGHHAEAAQFFVEAAEANPTAVHLAHAAGAIAEQDPTRARRLALRALDSLHIGERLGERLPALETGRVRSHLAKAFHAAGQMHSAQEQARLALEAAPQDPDVRALLNSLKLP